MYLWALTAAVLSIAALAGHYALKDVDSVFLSSIKCFAAGAVVASLSTEVFPKAFDEDHAMSGIAVALGLVGVICFGHL